MKRLHLLRKPKSKAQSLVEFALALPVFLLAVFGIMELSHFFLVYSSVYTVSREATRYGSAVDQTSGIPHYIDCAGIRQAGMDVGFFGGVNASDIDIRYESNAVPNENFNTLTRTCETYNADYLSDSANFSGIQSGDRIVVRTRATYRPIIGIIPPIPIETVNGRTIMRDLDIQGFTSTREPTPVPFTPVPSPTLNVNPQVEIIDDDPPDDDMLILRDYESGVKAINAIVTDFNPNNRIHTWTLESGDAANVTIMSPHTEDTTVNFTWYGLYTFQLEVFDGQYTGSDTIQVLANAKPVVSAGGPYELVGTDGNVCSTGDRFRLNGSASDAFGNASSPPVLTYSWQKVGGPGVVTYDPFAANTLDPYASFSLPGTYSFTLTANDGYISTVSDPVNVPVNYPPVVDAEFVGSNDPDNIVIELPSDVVEVTGNANNPDNLPIDGIDYYLWEKVSGPGSVYFDDASSQATTATFSASGTYQIRLTASDGCEMGFSDPITVHINQPPVVNANTITNQDVLIIPASALSVNLSGSVTDDGHLISPPTYLWTGPSDVTITNGTTLNPTISFGTPNFSMPPGSRILRLTANDGWVSEFDEVAVVNNTPPVADAGGDIVLKSYENAHPDGSGSYDVNFPYQSLTYSWVRAIGTGTGVGQVTILNASNAIPTIQLSSWGDYYFDLTVNDGLVNSVVPDRVKITKNAKPIASISATPLTIPLGGTVNLDGSGSYDPDGGYPNANLSFNWTSNPTSGVTISNANSEITSATFNSSGIFVVSLAVSDGLEFDTETVIIRVNAAPNVNAGSDQLLRSNVLTALLNGSRSDDGLGNPLNTLTYLWEQVSGPGTTNFSSTSVLNPSITLSTAGTYEYRLTVSDGWASSSDNVIVRNNQVPVANAGPDRTLVKNVYHTISGSGSDDGYPTPSNLTYLWTLVSQPLNGNAIFVNPNLANLSVTFDRAGTYVLQLRVNDGLESGYDQVTITVTN